MGCRFSILRWTDTVTSVTEQSWLFYFESSLYCHHRVHSREGGVDWCLWEAVQTWISHNRNWTRPDLSLPNGRTGCAVSSKKVFAFFVPRSFRQRSVFLKEIDISKRLLLQDWNVDVHYCVGKLNSSQNFDSKIASVMFCQTCKKYIVFKIVGVVRIVINCEFLDLMHSLVSTWAMRSGGPEFVVLLNCVPNKILLLRILLTSSDGSLACYYQATKPTVLFCWQKRIPINLEPHAQFLLACPRVSCFPTHSSGPSIFCLGVVDDLHVVGIKEQDRTSYHAFSNWVCFSQDMAVVSIFKNHFSVAMQDFHFIMNVTAGSILNFGFLYFIERFSLNINWTNDNPHQIILFNKNSLITLREGRFLPG